jgi:protein TonB
MYLRRRQDNLLLGFVTLSLLLHLLLAVLLPQLRLLPEAPARAPVFVDLVPPPPRTPAPSRERELDLPPALETPRTRPARRLGPTDRQVERETAPKGEMPEDRRAAAPRVAPAPPGAAARPETPALPPAPLSGPAAEEGTLPGAPPAPAARPSKETLMASASGAAARVAEQQVAEWRRKHRAEVEKGEAVWLDTERDLLISFFKRFRDNIYGVWNYPRRSAERGEEGTCLLRVTINRDGSVHEVRLVESSGYDALDQEAMAAVRKGAPYGALPRAYEEEALNIFAFFQYTLTRRYIY